MNTIWQFMIAHQVTCTLIAGYIWVAFITALPAPTAQSTRFYQFAFKFITVLAANIARASNTTVESSPNFQAAVNIQAKQAGLPPIPVQTLASNPKTP
jgi:hypothetical protein